MKDKSSIEPPVILYACYAAQQRSAEQFVQNHSITYIQSGTLELQLPDRKMSFVEGDAFFIRRHVLARATKQPAAGSEFKSISIFFSQEVLKDFSIKKELVANKEVHSADPVVTLSNDSLLKNYFESLPAYEKSSTSGSLIRLKVEEGLLLLLDQHEELQHVLFDFNDPGKIDLEQFMNEHFRFNVELKRFASLTGRSLATFKRDFEKIFHLSPSRWLQRKRLEEARYLIKVKGMKPSEVYLEVGFEDLSHFSFAFKKSYGVAPSYI